MSKVAKSASVIGGADGPTSIFLLGGKEKNIFRRIKNNLRNWKYRQKRIGVIRKIRPGAHSLEDTIRYMKSKYSAYEADETYSFYSERMSQLRYTIIQMHNPELIGANVQIAPPDNLEDREVLLSWMEKVRENQDNIMKKADSITFEEFPTYCHLYIIRTDNGTIEIETEDNRGLMRVSSSGDIKQLKKIIQDIYIYYGVYEEDIINKTRRYKSYVAELSQ